jgi:DNA-binding response OmpR family regulator
MIADKYRQLKSKTILYVEDDLDIQKSVAEIFSNFFETVLLACDGDEAYDIYLENQNRIDIIVTDINMPNTDGIELGKHIRKFRRDLPMVIISGYTDTEYLLESIDLNILTYITKPFTTQKTLTLLDKFLDYFEFNSHIVLAKNIEMDYDKSILYIEGKSIGLANKERIFLKLLAQNRMVRYDMIYEYMWDYSKPPSQNAVKSFMQKLKKKLPYELFHNKRGEGYYLSVLPAK